MRLIDFDRTAVKQIKSLPSKHAKQVIGKIQALSVDPEPSDSIQMKGKASAWRRATSGEYRIIYRVEGEIVKIAAVGHRNDDKVYRDFERRM